MQTILIVVLWALSTIISLFIGGFLKSYFSKKGENLATHEDIQKLLDQVKAVTQTTKEIEAKISNEVWDRQKHWELKREALFTITEKSAALKDAFNKYQVICKTSSDNQPVSIERNQAKIDAGNEYITIAADFDNKSVLVGLVCNKRVHVEAMRFSTFTRGIVLKLIADEPLDYDATMEAFAEKYNSFHDEIRKELGVIETVNLQSNESSATQSRSAPDRSTK